MPKMRLFNIKTLKLEYFQNVDGHPSTGGLARMLLRLLPCRRCKEEIWRCQGGQTILAVHQHREIDSIRGIYV